MAYFLSFSVLAVFVLILFLGLQAAKNKHDQLMQHSDPYKHWFEGQDLSLDRHRAVIKRVTLVLVVLGWVSAVVLAGLNEGVAYTLLVVFLGWAPAVALAVVLMAVLLGLYQMIRYVVFMVKWLVKANRTTQVSSAGKPDST